MNCLNKNNSEEYLFIFHHGWGNNSSYFIKFYKEIKNYIPNSSSFHFDSCYFSRTNNYLKQMESLKIIIQNNVKLKIIGIGHSIGFLKLIELKENSNIKFQYLFSFAGFLKFINSKNDLQTLNLTINAFKKNPKEVLKTFIQENVSFLNEEILLKELILLKNLDKTNIQNNMKLFHIYGARDLILGSKKSINATLELPIFQEQIIDTSTHYLPYYEMKSCLNFVISNCKDETI